MIFAQVATALTSNESSGLLWLVGIGVAAILWCCKVVLRVGFEMRDTLRDVHKAVFGDPKNAQPNGLVRDVESAKKLALWVADELETSNREFERWREENARIMNDAANRNHKLLLEIQEKLPQRKSK